MPLSKGKGPFAFVVGDLSPHAQYSKAEVSIPPQRQRLKPLSKSLSTLKGTIRELVGFSLL